MNSNLPPTADATDIMEAVITKGNLADLTAAERVAYYGAVCRSVGLNPLTRPFEYLDLNNGLTLYATRTATDQLRAKHHVSLRLIRAEDVDGVYIVTAEATAADGRTDQSTGAVPLVKEGGQWKTAQSGKRYFAGDGTYTPLGPVDRANAIMKCETKAKRRVTLSICGLGWMDESEVETIPTATRVTVDEDGVIQDAPTRPINASGRTEAPSPWQRVALEGNRAQIAEESMAEYFAVCGYEWPAVPDDILTKFADWCGRHSVAQVQQHIRETIAKSQDAPADEPDDEPDERAMSDAEIHALRLAIEGNAATVSAAELADHHAS